MKPDTRMASLIIKVWEAERSLHRGEKDIPERMRHVLP